MKQLVEMTSALAQLEIAPSPDDLPSQACVIANHPNFSFSKGRLHFLDKPYTGYTRELHDSGLTRRMMQWVNGQLDGLTVNWDGRGNITFQERYLENQLIYILD